MISALSLIIPNERYNILEAYLPPGMGNLRPEQVSY